MILVAQCCAHVGDNASLSSISTSVLVTAGVPRGTGTPTSVAVLLCCNSQQSAIADQCFRALLPRMLSMAHHCSSSQLVLCHHATASSQLLLRQALQLAPLPSTLPCHSHRFKLKTERARPNALSTRKHISTVPQQRGVRASVLYSARN